jgi:hypothetical protein
VSRRFASWAKVRCGIGIAISLVITRDGAARAGSSLRQRHASVPPLPSTLDVEGADQPFLLEIVAAQASSGRWAGCSFIAGTS